MKGPFLLDTSVVLHYVRGNEVATRIEAALQLRARAERPLLSVVSLGEALGFARHRGWGAAREDQLRALLDKLVPVDVADGEVIEAYAEMHAHLVRTGRTLSDNDIWIAACTRAASAVLVTTDKDFDPLHGPFLQRVYFEPRSHAGGDPPKTPA